MWSVPSVLLGLSSLLELCSVSLQDIYCQHMPLTNELPLKLTDIDSCIEEVSRHVFGPDSSVLRSSGELPLASGAASDTQETSIAPATVNDQVAVLAAVKLAAKLQERAVQLQTPQERRQQAELDRMLQHPEDKATLTQITDQSFRSSSPRRVVDQMVHILDVQGVPRFFSFFDQALLKGFQSFGEYLPGVAVPLVKDKMRRETSNVILPAEHPELTKHLRERNQQGLRMNVNFLGEAILGEKEARRRLEQYLASLKLPEIECVSAKISTLYSQISPLSRKHTVDVVSDRLELLYRDSIEQRFKKWDGTDSAKFVYLDMEEYRDLHLTAEIFMNTLDRAGMEQVRAGIALQAYIPDSHSVQRTITEWAKKRVERGGMPVTIRIVKGANMEMERVEASIRGWPQAPYQSKADTDANYKRMLQYGMEGGNNHAVHLGIASHNLFDLAYGLVLASVHNAMSRVQFEMLEGMANHQRRAVFELSRRVLLYAPACRRDEFINAIGYLVRRLDENTGPDNFLRHAFKIQTGSATWKRLEEGFIRSVQDSATVSSEPRRFQDRSEEPEQPDAPSCWQDFKNDPDTDFSLIHNSAWAESLIANWKDRCDSNATHIPQVIDGQEVQGRGDIYQSMDPSRPGVVAAAYCYADASQLKDVVDCAVADRGEWRQYSPVQRYEILRDVAQELRRARGDLIGAAIADAGKTVAEADPEVSEAIDFVEFYSRCGLDMSLDRRFAHKPAGVVVVVSPWNFPIAIPCGGIAAALAAGNTVILKPASDTALPAYVLCKCFWEAGVPREALQLVLCRGADAGKHLLNRPEISRVILTGGTETALQILNDRPDLTLFAETGGKNATIVSSLSDHDLAIKNIVHSAFSHSGQKCSATSLLLLEEELFENKAFREQLVDAVHSLHVGSSWELPTKMGPLIRSPQGDLLRGLSELEVGEEWALKSTMLHDNPCLYTPAIKWNVSPGGFTHRTELFGPVLGVMKYKRLEDAIELVHDTGYGLTSGLESLDDREQSIWKERLRAGNLYINRPTTGAIVLRQPFGGMGKSAFGPGIKAGGPHYVGTLVDFTGEGSNRNSDESGEGAEDFDKQGQLQSSLLAKFATNLARHQAQFGSAGLTSLKQNQAISSIASKFAFSQEDWDEIQFALRSYDQFARSEICNEHDHFRLIGQDNLRRYLPATPLRIRVDAQDTPASICLRIAAALSVSCKSEVSSIEGVHHELLQTLEQLTMEAGGMLEFIHESDEQLSAAIGIGQVARVRYSENASIPEGIQRAANRRQVYIDRRAVSGHGCIELLRYVVEQSVSFDYHRYGNLGTRASEARSSVM